MSLICCRTIDPAASHFPSRIASEVVVCSTSSHRMLPSFALVCLSNSGFSPHALVTLVRCRSTILNGGGFVFRLDCPHCILQAIAIHYFAVGKESHPLEAVPSAGVGQLHVDALCCETPVPDCPHENGHADLRVLQNSQPVLISDRERPKGPDQE